MPVQFFLTEFLRIRDGEKNTFKERGQMPFQKFQREFLRIRGGGKGAGGKIDFGKRANH